MRPAPPPIRLPRPENVVVKGVREEPEDQDGYRVLADRLWPRGVSRQRAALQEWAKDATPSTALRRAFHSGDLDWEEFVQAYREELACRPRAISAVEQLRDRALAGRVSLLVAARDREHCHARVLREAILGVQDPRLPG